MKTLLLCGQAYHTNEQSSTDRTFLGRYRCFHFSLPIADAITDIFALLKPQLKGHTP